jgi:hypothetical protein
MSIIIDSMKILMNVQQKEHESLQDYMKHFKTARDAMRSHIGGPIIFTKFVENMTGYDKTKTTEIPKFQEQAFNQFIAYTFLDKSDKAKYGTLLTGLNTQTSLKNNQYPKTITKASNVLSNHCFDNAGKIHNNNTRKMIK